MKEPNYPKIKQTILFIITRCQTGLNGLTLTKLYKILYFMDFGHYAKFASVESHYHYSWITTDNGSIIPLITTLFCDFEWLDYFHDKTQEEFEEIKNSRMKFLSNSRLQKWVK